MQSYDRLGLTQLRDDTDRVMRKSFPNSGFLTGTATAGATGNKGRAWWQFW
jgi:outer membrane protein assembly factor BamD